MRAVDVGTPGRSNLTKREKLMQPIRVTIHPEDVPAGYEAEAVYRVPDANEHTISSSGLQKTSMVPEPYFIPRLILTPKRPSLAQRVKDSGWRCPIGARTISCMRSAAGDIVWGIEINSGYLTPLRSDPLLESSVTSEEHCPVVIKIDDEGYPIVDDE
jgi:hypothetical protein